MRRSTGKYYTPKKQLFTAKGNAKKYYTAGKRTVNVKTIAAVCLCAAVLICGVLIKGNLKANAVDLADYTSVSFNNISTYPRIVNSSGRLSASFAPQNLVSLNTVPNGESVLLRSDAAESFIAMLSAMANDGLAVIPIKGYTTYEEQEKEASKVMDTLIAEGHSQEEADRLFAQKLVAPGENEAQLGTSLDVSTDINSLDKFDTTEQYEWICSNSYKYGYIVRYPSDKVKITGVESKPWHIRYVGEEAASCMKSENLCLEEYVDKVISENPGAMQID